MKKIAYYTSGIILIATVWIIMSEVFTESIIPYPHKVLLKLCQILMLPSTYINLAITIIRTLSGFALAFVIGTGIGIATGSILAIERIFFFPVIILQGAPPILWIIPLMLIVGTEGAAPVVVVFFITLPLVIINIQEGRKTISPLMRDMFRIYADSKKMKLTELIIPSLAPYLKTILILGVILALKSSIIGEWFGAKNGIGRIVNEYFYTFDMTSFYATALLFLIIVGILAFFSRWVGNYFFPNRRKSMTAEKNKFIPNNYFNPAFTSLDLKNVIFSYSKKNIISLEHFHISSGETAVLTGNSGCGKTTLAKIICGILKPHSGSVSLPCNPGMIFQEDVLLNHLDCFGNASLPARWKRIQGYESITLYFLELCELTENINLYPDELSGGMKKLLSFARALMLNPDFMILDEPFNNLHKEARIKLWDMYFDLFVKRKIPSIIITHYPEELTNRNITLYEMKEGNIIRSK
ncbi:MAG: ATP-binding cassette domain-containing protein [Spirochaetes bacterium]|nr:ATP-binding cassette domain-containing protein [Spirochaetota bacterium]